MMERTPLLKWELPGLSILVEKEEAKHELELRTHS